MTGNKNHDIANYKQYKGKYLFAYCAKPNERRMFIFDPLLPPNKQNGRRNIFTLATNAVSENGIYLCRIVHIKADRNGYVNFIVEPLKNIETSDAILQNATISYFHLFAKLLTESELFYSPFHRKFTNEVSQYNLKELRENVADTYNRFIPVMDDEFFDTLFRGITEGKISWRKAVAWMTIPTVV